MLKVADIVKRREEVIYFAIPILTKPKPRPVKAETPNGTQTPQSGTQTPDPGAKQQQQQQQQPQQQQEGPTEMDVD